MPDGAGGLPGNIDNPATMSALTNGLNSWNDAHPGNAGGILEMIKGGKSLPEIQMALQSLRTTTTNPQNTAFLDKIIDQANNPILQATQQGGGDPGGAPGGIPSQAPGNAFDMLSKFPGYQFQFDQGLQAMNRNLSAGGRYTSGAMLKDAQTFGQGQAQSAVTNYLDILKYLGSLGESAGAQTGNFGMQTGSGIAGSQMAGGTALSSGIMGANNAWNSGITGAGTAIGNALNSQVLQSYLKSSGSGGFTVNNHNAAPNWMSAASPW